MPILFLVGTAVGLSMDACAVAISRGLGAQHASWRRAATMGAVFGLFQGVMPCIGFALGVGARDAIAAFDHWVAFILLAAIGGKMLWEARLATTAQPAGWPSLGALLLLGLATSVDALAAGFSLATLEVPLLLSAGLIGGITFVLSTLCAHFGRHLGAGAGRAADVFGGLLLIGLGVWILVGHLGEG